MKSLWKAAELSVKITRADRSMTFLHPEAGTDYMYQSMWELHAHGVSVNKMDLLALKLRVNFINHAAVIFKNYIKKFCNSAIIMCVFK